jgi:7-cyano-7-deazaguanine reductase
MRTKLGYSDKHAESGIKAKLPDIECWPNQYPNYTNTVTIPEFTSICPKTGLPDFGTVTITYCPDKLCLELKSLKMYIHAYRDLGIFQENVVNRVLRDVVKACRPKWCIVKGEFASRGGLESSMEATFGQPKEPFISKI